MSDRERAAAEVRNQTDLLASAVTERQFARYPDLARRFGSAGRARCVEDARFHWSFLAAAVESAIDAIFVDYVAWARTILVARRVPAEDLRTVLESMATLTQSPLARVPVELAIERFDAMSDTLPTLVEPATLAQQYLDALRTMDGRSAIRVVAEALARGTDTATICVDVLQRVQQEIGRLWQLNEITVAVEHFCSKVTQQLLTQLGTFGRATVQPQRKRVIALCPPGEHHDIGLHALTTLLSLAGWHTIQLGANVPSASAVRMAADWKSDAVLISVALPSHLDAVKEVIHLLRKEPATKKVRVLVGGRAFATYPDLWHTTGADGTAADAPQAIEELRRALG